MSTTLGVSRPDQAAYMLRAAASDAGREYKQRLIDLLDIRPGQTALDVGCGPGADLPALAERVGERGTVIGVDRDPAMLARARERTASLSRVEVREGDVHVLPVEPGSVDRARIDRVLMHVAQPAEALAQVHLATRPGALVGLVEPDWDTLVVDAEDCATSRLFTRYTTDEVVRHATIGRSIARLAHETGCPGSRARVQARDRTGRRSRPGCKAFQTLAEDREFTELGRLKATVNLAQVENCRISAKLVRDDGRVERAVAAVRAAPDITGSAELHALAESIAAVHAAGQGDLTAAIRHIQAAVEHRRNPIQRVWHGLLARWSLARCDLQTGRRAQQDTLSTDWTFLPSDPARTAIALSGGLTLTASSGDVTSTYEVPLYWDWGAKLLEGWEHSREMAVYGHPAGARVPIGLYRVGENLVAVLERQIGQVVMPRSQVAVFTVPEDVFHLVSVNPSADRATHCLSVPGAVDCVPRPA